MRKQIKVNTKNAEENVRHRDKHIDKLDREEGREIQNERGGVSRLH